MRTQENKVDLGKALDADLVVTKSNEIESGKQDTTNRSGNNTDADDADMRPIYDKEPMAETDCKTILTKLKTTFENAFNSEFKERMQKYTRFNAQSFKDAMIYNMDSIGRYMVEIILHQQWTS
nr:hypothetical protein [Tanacetum cinerariifolium]